MIRRTELILGIVIATWGIYRIFKPPRYAVQEPELAGRDTVIIIVLGVLLMFDFFYRFIAP